MRLTPLLMLCGATLTAHISVAQVQQAGGTARVRAALVVVNDAGTPPNAALMKQLETAILTKSRLVNSAQVDVLEDGKPLRGGSNWLVIRGTIVPAGSDLRFTVIANNPFDSTYAHHLVETASATNATAAIDRLASRVAGMLLMHADPERTRPELYSVSTYEAYRAMQHAESTFATNQTAALPLVMAAYQLDTMNVSPLFLAVAIHNNLGHRPVSDSLLKQIVARQDRLTEIEKFNIGWYSASVEESFRAAQSAAKLDPVGWSYAVGLRANAAGYYEDALEALSHRAQLAAAGSYSARTWGPWRSQTLIALHANGQYARELDEIKLARADFARDDVYVAEEMRALAGMGRGAEAHAIATKLLSQPAKSVNLNVVVAAAQELKRHGQTKDGLALIQETAAFGLAHESEVDSLALTIALAVAGRLDEALPRAEALATNTTAVNRIANLAIIATAAHRKDVADRASARLTGDAAADHFWRGYIAAITGDCQTAVAHFQMALQKGQTFGAPGWWHASSPTEPIWGCEAFQKLVPMRAK